jgi:hypothetical protein
MLAHTLNRRTLLSSAALGAVAIGIAGCTTAQTQTINQVVDDVNTLAGGVAAILPSLTTITGFAADTVAKVQGYIANIEGVASQVASVASQGASAVAPLVSNLGSLVSSIYVALGGSSLPSSVSLILQAAQALLPVILTAAGIALAPAAAPSMSAAQARLVLRAAAVGGR